MRDHLLDMLEKCDAFKAKNYESALKDLYVKIDKELATNPKVKAKLKTYRNGSEGMYMSAADDIAMGCGCTAVSAILTADKIYLANAGDSRAIVGLKEGTHIKAVPLSEDHKPDNIEEKARIEKAGGFVEENRVKGILALSRSLGDLEYKQDKKLKPEQ